MPGKGGPGRKKKRTVFFKRKEVTSGDVTNTSIAPTNNSIPTTDNSIATTDTVTTENKEIVKKRKLTTEIERLSHRDFWGGRPKPLAASTTTQEYSENTPKRSIREGNEGLDELEETKASKENMKLGSRGSSGDGNIIIDYTSLKSNIEKTCVVSIVQQKEERKI